ncbi:MAG: cysteine synthase A [Clostridia bacterium]|nr:cysteine synthase A [Clostridia bacterium]
MKIYNSLDEIIGNTPLLRLRNTEKAHSLTARLFAKTEYFNPAGSVKDRTAKFMIDSAEKSGVLKRGMTLIEPTSGNTGIALAAIGASRGYKVILTMPETMSVERRKLISAYGAEIVLTDGKKGMAGAIEKAEQLKGELNGVILGQFVNPANVSAHFLTTGPEIWNDTDGTVDIFVAGVGTGGTVTGVGRYLKSKNEAVKIIAVEPQSSPVLSKGKSGAHAIQGIGAGFVPEILDTHVYDMVLTVSDADALSAMRETVKREGLFIGISSGAALCAGIEIAKSEENTGKNIVLLFPDGGDRYLSVI